MEDTVKYNYLKSLGRRNQYINNVSDIIAKTIKNELRIYEKDNPPLSDTGSEIDLDDNSDESSDDSEELNNTPKNPYSYILDQFKDILSSEKCSNLDNSSNENRTTVHIKYSEPDHTHNEENLVLDQNISSGSKSEKTSEDAYNEPDLSLLEKSGTNEDSTINSYLPHIVLRKLNSNKDPLQLNKVFTNLERNLSDVRLKYRKTLSNLSLKSSAVRRNYRLSCFNSVDPKNINKGELNQEPNHDKIINKPEVDRINFDLNKWLDELPDDLKNFIEVESITSLNSIKDFKESKPSNDNKIYKMDLNSTDDKDLRENASEKEPESGNEIKKEDKKPVPEKGYIEYIHEDYIEPLRNALSEDFKTGIDGIKQGISDLYNNSPNIFQNLFGSSEPNEDQELSKKLSKQLNSYYDDTDRKTRENDPEAPNDVNDEFDKDFKYFDMKDKYQSFDISDGKPEISTPVVNKDFNENYVVYKENHRVKSPEKVIRSVADYNIGFLSNLWTINENCKLVRNENIRSRSNTIKPWFGSPAEEALYRQRTLENPKEDYKECTTILDKERGIKYKVIMDDNGQPKYLIDNIEPGDEETAKNFKGTVSTMQKNKYRNQKNSSHSKVEEGFFDPMLKHQEKMEQTKLINETDFAIFGRRKVTRTNR